jgi:TPR repeat protein
MGRRGHRRFSVKFYELGEGVKTDYEEAARWYRRSIGQGETRSATRLGAILFEGKGLGRDLQEAVKLWTWAADREDAYAQFDLAGMYLAGTGVHRDLVKAYSLFTSAGKTLDVSKPLSELSSKMSQDELAKLQ